MLQQLIALGVIAYFVARLSWQYRKKSIAKTEFRFWLVFWLAAMVLIASIKQIDQLVASLGFSGSGISILADVAIIVLFYFIFRLRLRVVKLERDITRLVEALALK